MILFFWVSAFIIFYTYVGYGMLLFLIVRLKPARPRPDEEKFGLPTCTLVIAAYNEEDFIREKIQNSLLLEYPAGKLKLIFVTDGSTDQTPVIVSEFPEIKLLHSADRKGKIAAIHRAMKSVNSEIVVFTDANTILNTEALKKIARWYQDPTVGAVAGEKRVMMDHESDAGAAGEGFYWKYESKLKEWDSELYSVVGAAGELFSIRTSLYEAVEPDSILDDFMISMRIAAKGYRIVYEPEAFAVETASENIREELKRKIRIAAGGIQSVIRLRPLLNIFRYGLLSFQYISHRVLRWTITPVLLIAIFFLNLIIIIDRPHPFYQFIFAAQIVFYVLALAGALLGERKMRIRIFFIPYYFCVMNYAVLAGIIRYISGTQGAAWQKAKRRL